MEGVIKKFVLKLFPELTARYHLPIFAEVVGVRETPNEGDLCDEFRPKYAVDVQVLDEYGEPDKSYPLLRDVILALPVAGQEMGFFAYPENGTWVEIAFAYGSPNRPFIRSVLPHRLTLPEMERGEQRWQHNPATFQRVDKKGNWDRKTDQTIVDDSLQRVVRALDNLDELHRSFKAVATDDIELIGAKKHIDALGAMILQSGDTFDMSSVGNIRLTTRANTILRTIGDIQSTTDGKQHFEAPKSWVGDDTENAIRLMSETAQLVIDLADILATHTHPNTGQITQSGQVTNISTLTAAVKVRIDQIAE